MTRATDAGTAGHTGTTGRDAHRPERRQLAREARGLAFVYALFALVCGALAFQCVEKGAGESISEPARGGSAPGR